MKKQKLVRALLQSLDTSQLIPYIKLGSNPQKKPPLILHLGYQRLLQQKVWIVQMLVINYLMINSILAEQIILQMIDILVYW